MSTAVEGNCAWTESLVICNGPDRLPSNAIALAPAVANDKAAAAPIPVPPPAETPVSRDGAWREHKFKLVGDTHQ